MLDAALDGPLRGAARSDVLVRVLLRPRRDGPPARDDRGRRRRAASRPRPRTRSPPAPSRRTRCCAPTTPPARAGPARRCMPTRRRRRRAGRPADDGAVPAGHRAGARRRDGRRAPRPRCSSWRPPGARRCSTRSSRRSSSSPSSSCGPASCRARRRMRAPPSGCPGILPGNALSAQAWLAIVLLARGDVDGAAAAVAATAPVLAAPPAVQLHIALAAHAGVQHARGEIRGAAATYRDLLARQRARARAHAMAVAAGRRPRAARRRRRRTMRPRRSRRCTRTPPAGGPPPPARSPCARAPPRPSPRPPSRCSPAPASCSRAARPGSTRPARSWSSAAALRRTGRRADARPVAPGRPRAGPRCGALGLVTRAHEELVLAGAKPRRLQFSGVESLTAAERRVAELAAEGLTNRAIAQRALRHPQDGREPARPRVHQARHRLPRGARRHARIAAPPTRKWGVPHS